MYRPDQQSRGCKSRLNWPRFIEGQPAGTRCTAQMFWDGLCDRRWLSIQAAREALPVAAAHADLQGRH